MNAVDTNYSDLKIQAMRYSPSEASFIATNRGTRVSSRSLYEACEKSSNGDSVISLNLDSKCRIWLYASLRRGDEFLFNFDFEICDGAGEGGFIRIDRPRIGAMSIPLWESRMSRSNKWENCVVSSRKICNSGDLEATVLISWYKNKVTRAGSCAVALSYFKKRNKNATLELRSVHDPSVKIATLNVSCSFKVKRHKYRDLSGLFRSSPQVVTNNEESKRDNNTSSIVVAEKKDTSNSEIAIFEINRRGSVVPVSRTPHDVKISSSGTLTSSHYQDKITALREERSRLETLNELFVKLEDKRPVVKLQDKRAQLEAMEREMRHLLSLRLRRRRFENREDYSEEEEEKIRKNEHLIAYHSKSALIRQRHGHNDDSWSKSTRFARDNIFLKRAVREFRSHTRHSLYTSKRPISTLKAENMEAHWNESRAQTHSHVDDGSWYVV